MFFTRLEYCNTVLYSLVKRKITVIFIFITHVYSITKKKNLLLVLLLRTPICNMQQNASSGSNLFIMTFYMYKKPKIISHLMGVIKVSLSRPCYLSLSALSSSQYHQYLKCDLCELNRGDWEKIAFPQ